jgi:hypothetical protein
MFYQKMHKSPNKGLSFFRDYAGKKWLLRGPKHADILYRFQVSGFGCQEGASQSPETSYETSSELRRVGHRADHIPAGTVARPTLPKFLFRLDRPFFWPAAGLNTDT